MIQSLFLRNNIWYCLRRQQFWSNIFVTWYLHMHNRSFHSFFSLQVTIHKCLFIYLYTFLASSSATLAVRDLLHQQLIPSLPVFVSPVVCSLHPCWQEQGVAVRTECIVSSFHSILFISASFDLTHSVWNSQWKQEPMSF